MKTWKLNITVSVADSWIADGFDMSERLDDLQDAIQGMLPYSYGHEVKVKATVTSAPDKATILALQNGQLEPKD